MHLIMVAPTFIVYLDEDLYVEWSTTDDYDWPGEAGAIMNRYGYLEVLAEPVAPDSRLRIQRLLGESVARILDDRDSAAANAILDRAEAILCNPGRYRYIAAATAVAAVAAALVFVLWISRQSVQEATGPNAFQVALASGMGAIGALMSIILRTRSIVVDPAEPAAAQYAEGAYRAFVGMIGGLLAALAVKANLAFGFLSERGVALIALCGAIAGVSERLVPSLVRRVEESVFSRGGPKTQPRKKSRRK
ncbi:MAG TPA: hypothetical protein VEO74_03310 [Thermoanaerobaculia bacterium]|nr:hypothetical protein [Thermoanaerobaculia bacterium]